MTEHDAIRLHGRSPFELGECAAAGCDHPYLAPGSDLCLVHNKLIYDFRIWLKHDLAADVDLSATVRKQRLARGEAR